MKNTFAAHRHLPTDAIHILDLALFQKQRMPDGATSLAYEYINEDGEKVFAVIASGEQDEHGVAYVLLSEKENAEIMEAWFNCGGGEFPALSGEYQFESDDELPEHIIATVEFIQPETETVEVEKIRTAIANYMRSEGCSCCRSYDHGDNKKAIAELLGVEMYDDGSGYDFTKYQTPTPRL